MKNKIPLMAAAAFLYKHRDKLNKHAMDEAIRLGRAAADRSLEAGRKTAESLRQKIPEVWTAIPDRDVREGDRVQRKNHPNHRGELASVKDGFAMVWWDNETELDVKPPIMIPYADLEHERRRIF